MPVSATAFLNVVRRRVVIAAPRAVFGEAFIALTIPSSLVDQMAAPRTFAPDRTLVAGIDPDAHGPFWRAGLGGSGMGVGVAAGEVIGKDIDGSEHPLATILSRTRVLVSRANQAAASFMISRSSRNTGFARRRRRKLLALLVVSPSDRSVARSGQSPRAWSVLR